MAGAQFTLSYDESRIVLGAPVLASDGATVFAKETAPGEMTVLVFNLSGDYLDLPDESFVSFPVELSNDRATGQMQIDFYFCNCSWAVWSGYFSLLSVGKH